MRITVEEKLSNLLKLAANPKTSDLHRKLALSYVEVISKKALSILREIDYVGYDLRGNNINVDDVLADLEE